jgi:hypothetical protein
MTMFIGGKPHYVKMIIDILFFGQGESVEKMATSFSCMK